MIRFSKYHGCGNSFVIIRESELVKDAALVNEGGAGGPEESAATEFTKAAETDRYPQLAQRVCDVNTGVGADGMIVVREKPQLEMVFYNCDGSRAPMCGNGIRCFAHFCSTEGIAKSSSYPVKTLAGDMIVNVVSEEPFRVKINMGKPLFSGEDIKTDLVRDNYLDLALTLKDGSEITVSSFFMGTIHTVVFVENFADIDVPAVGAEICSHPVFREKTNVNFVKMTDAASMEVRTYERGVGMTLACGTGACASVVAANLKGLCGKKADVLLKLGTLGIEIADDGNVYMEGPSEKVFDGQLC